MYTCVCVCMHYVCVYVFIYMSVYMHMHMLLTCAIIICIIRRHSIVVGTGFDCRFRVFSLLSVKVCFWYKTHSKTGNLAGVRYVCILSIIQFRLVTVSFEAFSGYKTIMYTLKVGFTILNNLIWDWGSDCNCMINGRVELLVEYILRRRLSKILFFIPVVTVSNASNNNQSRLTTYWSNIETTWGDAHRDTKCEYHL